ncbi:MAG: hypothetical protein B7Z51_10920 [Methyloversatilis sp. 12-65-5]|nr:MAG: hypothetical protein B7Z51_10920 [Methyloversatilis sp. 12-65-5]
MDHGAPEGPVELGVSDRQRRTAREPQSVAVERGGGVQRGQGGRLRRTRPADTQLRTERRELATLKRDAARLGRLIEALSKKSARTVPRPAPGGPSPADDPEPARNKADTGPVVKSLPVDHGGQPFVRLRGKLPWPASGELARRFGAQSADGGTPLRGIFIRAGAGDVKAVAAGTVVFADWLRGFGNLIIVDHGDHYLSVYGNNEALLKGVGARVGGGENIALIGSSGGVLESGLYFELRHQGLALDPLKWVSR